MRYLVSFHTQVFILYSITGTKHLFAAENRFIEKQEQINRIQKKNPHQFQDL